MSVVSDDEDNVYIDDNDEHDDETGHDSDDDADETVDTDEALRHECKSISECVWQSKPLPRLRARLHYVKEIVEYKNVDAMTIFKVSK